MNFKSLSKAIALTLGLSVITQAVPYEPIAHPYHDTKGVDQQVLDSLNIAPNPIRVNQAGYLTQEVRLGKSHFYFIDYNSSAPSSFKVIDESGTQVGQGSLNNLNKTGGAEIEIRASNNAQITKGGDTRYTMQSDGTNSGTVFQGFLPTDLAEDKSYRITVNSHTSHDFFISEDIYGMVRDATIKFFGVNRSGDSESWFHPASHTLDGSENGTPGSHSGGWYDCGDHLKEGITQGFALEILATMAAASPEIDADHYAYNHNQFATPDGIPDMMREARHGADFFLKAYDAAAGDVSNMVTGVGDYGQDHSWWGQPQYQDGVTPGRGGPDRPLRKELGRNITGSIITGLAFTSKLYENYDPAYSVKAMTAAKAIYEYAKTNGETNSTSPAYNGEGSNDDDIALAAVALAWATKDKQYIDDLAYNTAIGNNHSTAFPQVSFEGGWLSKDEAYFTKSNANLDWASIHPLALWAFYKLILPDETTAATYDITAAERLKLVEKILGSMLYMFSEIGKVGTNTTTLPSHGLVWLSAPSITHSDLWYEMHSQQGWIFNRYQLGNTAELLLYADIAEKESGTAFSYFPASTDWKWAKAREVALKQFDYILGVNPWDMSMIYGIGDKNPNHPHHRGANPEGRNVPGAMYEYRPPVGALFGGFKPDETHKEHFDDFYHTETCIDAASISIMASSLLAKNIDRSRAPEVTFFVEYVGADKAIIKVKQDRFGSAVIKYGTSPSALTGSASTDENGVLHLIELNGLENGTDYYFEIVATNNYSGNQTTLDNEGEKYTFTTLATPPTSAEISNITICNVSSDSAEVLWFTPNGDYGSKIYWDTSPVTPDKMANSLDVDVNGGIPTKFHFMKIGDLQERTTYYFAVESDGEIESTDEDGNLLQFTTPIEFVDFDIYTLTYNWGGKPGIEMNIINQDVKSYDSLEVRYYFRAADGAEDLVGVRVDICQAYDEAGFNNPCDESMSALNTMLKNGRAVRQDDTYDAITDTYSYYYPIPLGRTLMKSGSRIRMDFVWIARSPWDPNELLDDPPAITFDDDDWSWGSKSKAAGNPVDYSGMPSLPKNYGDAGVFDYDINNYLTVYRKEQFISGFSPSYTEQSQKLAQYQMDVRLESPFDSPNGTILQIEQSSPILQIEGSAEISEGGEITSVWVNDTEIENPSQYITWNAVNDEWDFKFPARAKLGDAELNLTIFAGPDADCESCQENGGCAFENFQWKVKFDAGDVTPAMLTLLTPDGSALPKEQVPDQAKFVIRISDKDQTGLGTLPIFVINKNRQDTIEITLKEENGSGVFFSSILSGVRKSNPGSDEITFFGGDTIVVFYQDPAAPELDFVDDYFYALPQFEFAEAMVRDPNCDGNYELFLRLVDELPSGVEFDSIKIEIGEDFKATIAKSSLNQTGASYTTPLDLSSISTTDFRGEMQAWVTMPGEEQSSSNRVLDDGVPPRFTEVGIVESFETDPATRIDTIKLGFSEGVIIPSSNVLLDFFNTNKELQTHTMEFVDLFATDEDSRVWSLLVRNNTVVPVDNVSDFYALINDGNITDISRNSISDCSLDTLPIQFLPQPVPIELANIVDYTEDGAADSIHIRFVRKLRPIDIPDSLEVEWGYPNSTTYYYPNTAWKFIDSDSTELVVNLTDEYKMPHGMTAGTQGNGNGLFTSRVGSELIGTRSEKILQDKVGPVVATATYTPSGFLDRLIINYSEPLDTVSTGEVLLKTKKRGRSTVEGDFTNFISQDWLGEAGDPLYRSSFVYDTTVTSYVTLLDSARMPFEDTPLADLSGNKAGKNNNFVVIKGQSRTPDYNLDVSYVERLNNITPSQLDEMKEIYTTESSYKDRFILSIGDVNEADRWVIGGGQGRIPIEPASNPISYSTFGPTLKVVVNDIPTIGGFDANGFPRDGNVDSIKIELSLSFVIYDHLGQFVNQVSTPTFTIDNPNWVNSSNQIVFYLEWLPDPTKGGPRSADGRIVGTGGYIGQLDFNMKLRDDSPDIEGVTKERDGKKTWEGKSFFGFKRFKK